MFFPTETFNVRFYELFLRPRAFIFCVKQCLVSPFIIPANRDPRVQIGWGRNYLP